MSPTDVNARNWERLCEWMEPRPQTISPGPEWNAALYGCKWWRPSFVGDGTRKWVPRAQTLDACALAEAEIERRGLWEAYRLEVREAAYILLHERGDDKNACRYIAAFDTALIRLTPAQCCAAMLAAIEVKQHV